LETPSEMGIFSSNPVIFTDSFHISSYLFVNIEVIGNITSNQMSKVYIFQGKILLGGKNMVTVRKKPKAKGEKGKEERNEEKVEGK